MESFVRDYGTGSQIPDPPAFVNYQAPEAIPSSSARPTFRNAIFVRSSNRESPIRTTTMTDEELVINAAGVGAGGGGGHRRADSYAEGGDLSRRNTQAASSSSHTNHSAYTNGVAGHQGNQTQQNVRPSASPAASTSPHSQARQSIVVQTPQQQQLHRVLQDPYAEPIDPTAETYIRVGASAYRVDPMKDPQQAPPPSARSASSVASPTKSTVGTEADPLVKQLEELNYAVSTTGSTRKNTVIGKSGSTPDPKSHSTASSISSNRQATVGSLALSPPGSAVSAAASHNRSPSPARDYRNSAEMVIGPHPSVSRPASPNPPTAAFMVPNSAQPTKPETVQEIISDYQQSLPGEHKSISRNNSRNGSRGGSRSGQPNVSVASQAPQEQQHHGQNLARPPSSVGHAGVGAHGGSRSNSPQPTISRGPSPQPGQLVNRNSFMQLPAGASVARAPSPNAVGIALDPSGRVMHDEMAQRYQQQQPPQSQSPMRRGAPSQAQQTPYNPPPQTQQVAPPMQQQQQRKPSYLASPTGGQPYAPVTPPPMAVPPAGMYHTTSSPQPSYVAPPVASVPPPGQPMYNPPPPQQPAQYQQQNRYVQQQQPPQQAPPAAQLNQYGALNADMQRAPSIAYYDNRTPAQQMPPPPAAVPQQMLGIHQQQQQQQALQQRGYPALQPQPGQTQQRLAEPVQPNQVRRSPSPQPPQQTTEDGMPVLFYGESAFLVQSKFPSYQLLVLVRALYDYTATIEEEFDFQAADIIAVTSTPEDGWWTGELLDETRRQKGRNVFPSNFVTFF